MQFAAAPLTCYNTYNTQLALSSRRQEHRLLLSLASLASAATGASHGYQHAQMRLQGTDLVGQLTDGEAKPAEPAESAARNPDHSLQPVRAQIPGET